MLVVIVVLDVLTLCIGILHCTISNYIVVAVLVIKAVIDVLTLWIGTLHCTIFNYIVVAMLLVKVVLDVLTLWIGALQVDPSSKTKLHHLSSQVAPTG